MIFEEVIKGKVVKLYLIQIKAQKIKVLVLDNTIPSEKFYLSLQPTGDDLGLPTYQLAEDEQNKISKETKKILPKISAFLVKNQLQTIQ